MWDEFEKREGPGPAEYAGGLVSGLQELRLRFQDAVARLVGRSVAGAVGGLLRRLLGWPREGEQAPAFEGHQHRRFLGWGEDEEEDGQAGGEMEGGLTGGWPMPPAPAGWLWSCLAELTAWLMSLLG